MLGSFSNLILYTPVVGVKISNEESVKFKSVVSSIVVTVAVVPQLMYCVILSLWSNVGDCAIKAVINGEVILKIVQSLSTLVIVMLLTILYYEIDVPMVEAIYSAPASL